MDRHLAASAPLDASRESRAPLARLRLATLGIVLLLGSARIALGQTQFEERAVKRYFPAIADRTHDLVVADWDGNGTPDALTANDVQQARLYLNDGQGIFADVTATHLVPTNSMRRRAGAGDIDGDGDPDALLTAGLFAIGPALLLVNDGTGHFSDQTFTRMPNHLQSGGRPLFGDVDGDLDLDIVCANQNSFGKVNLFLNDGAGFFTDASSQVPPPPNAARDAALADVDGDLDLDLVLANSNQDRLYLNDGLGFFVDVTASQLPVETRSALCVAFADVDLDLDVDILVGNTAQPTTLLLNDGAGFFSDASNQLPFHEDTTNSVAAGDVDEDLDLDIVVGNDDQSRLYRNDGTGTFADAPFPARGSDPDKAGGLGFSDVDGDGDVDLLMGRNESDRLYLNDGSGTFLNAAPERIQWSMDDGSAAEIADVDGDGDQDVLIGNGEHFSSRGFRFGKVFFNDGTGAFPSAQSLPSYNPVALGIGDVDGDADADILAANAWICFAGYGCTAISNELYFNDGGGGFAKISGRLPPDADDTLAVALADVDGDADLDAVLGNWQQQSRLYENDGAGTFTDVTPGRMPARQDSTRALAVADFDGDDDLDIVLGNEGQQSRMYVNGGEGAFSDATVARMPALARKTRALGAGDLDGDGDLDLVLGSDGKAGLYLNDGTGRLLDSTERMPEQSEETWALRLGDVDEDGDLDVVLGNRGPEILFIPGGPSEEEPGLNRLLTNDGTAHFSDRTETRLPSHLDRTAALALGDLDRDRDLDLVVVNLAQVNLSPFTQAPIDTNRIYLNLHRQLSARLLPISGRTYEVELHSRPGYGTGPSSAVVAFSFALRPTPLPTAYGPLFLQPPLTFLPATSIPSPGGSTVISLAVPTDPTLVGVAFFGQAAILGGGPRLTGYLQDRFTK